VAALSSFLEASGGVMTLARDKRLRTLMRTLTRLGERAEAVDEAEDVG
jgi:hypothetical protein